MQEQDQREVPFADGNVSSVVRAELERHLDG